MLVSCASITLEVPNRQHRSKDSATLLFLILVCSTHCVHFKTVFIYHQRHKLLLNARNPVCPWKFAVPPCV
ncbi:uncharacterized protein B0H64DRAFT_392498 [Chaetomium fimeti]|uniref:Uncharacterized protein n=1 Tax=Chaetomium fimeti TaxID=1854472 RepID=A0AAE0HJD0_9PEZI|nr:hypothetical protein B0H64DRAFT_392498 [Chaetomium fimeti]